MVIFASVFQTGNILRILAKVTFWQDSIKVMETYDSSSNLM